MLSQQVKELETKYQQALELAGSILATLKVNRGSFMLPNAGAHNEFNRLLEQWNEKLTEINRG